MSLHPVVGMSVRLRIVIALGLTFIASSQALADEKPIRIGMIPDAGATQVSVEQKAPLRAYLQKALGRPVTLIIPTNYNATVEGLGNDSLDIAYLGGLTFVKAHERYGAIPLVQREADREFHALFITQANSKIDKLSDLKGKTFAFGDINSTSGHLMPYRTMLKAGVDPDKDLKFRYTGSHAATVKAVESGTVDAGACDETVYKEMTNDGKADGTKLRVFYTTQPFVDYVWAARANLDVPTQKAVAKAFTDLKPGKDDEILAILRGRRFVAADNAEYDAIRATAKQLKLF
ncbi:MAG TPA: phosphate/phosphite/phosphonate ABC transporter substrate-binding protein [Xanthobacteraceae bacterium]